MSALKNTFRVLFRSLYYAVYGRAGKAITINNEQYVVSAHTARGINPVIDELPLKLLCNLAKDANILFDIGANIGVISLILSKKMKPGSTIYAFEPAPATFVYLKDTARVQKGNAKVIAFNNAISNKNEVLRFTNLERTTRNHVVTDNRADTLPVNAIALDSFCAEHKVIPEVIKIDIEGAEYWALQGMAQTLKHNNITVLVEIHPEYLATNDITGKMFEDYILSIDYKAFDISGSEIPASEILHNTIVVLAKQKPAATVFNI